MKAGVKTCLNCEHCREVYPGLGVVHCGQVVEAMQGIDTDFAYECSDYKPTLPEVKPEPKLLVRWRGILKRTLARMAQGDEVWSPWDLRTFEPELQAALAEHSRPWTGLTARVARSLSGAAAICFNTRLLVELEMTTRAEQCSGDDE